MGNRAFGLIKSNKKNVNWNADFVGKSHKIENSYVVSPYSIKYAYKLYLDLIIPINE